MPLKSNSFAEWSRRGGWGVAGFCGYLLSPLSWWNDMWVNIPLAYAAAMVAYHIRADFFLPIFAAAYWVTNIAGLLLLHAGARGALSKDRGLSLNRLTVWKWLAVSLLYTVAIIWLCHMNILRPWRAYFHAP